MTQLGFLSGLGSLDSARLPISDFTSRRLRILLLKTASTRTSAPTTPWGNQPFSLPRRQVASWLLYSLSNPTPSPFLLFSEAGRWAGSICWPLAEKARAPLYISHNDSGKWALDHCQSVYDSSGFRLPHPVLIPPFYCCLRLVAEVVHRAAVESFISRAMRREIGPAHCQQAHDRSHSYLSHPLSISLFPVVGQ